MAEIKHFPIQFEAGHRAPLPINSIQKELISERDASRLTFMFFPIVFFLPSLIIFRLPSVVIV